ncbi:hypothetical protein DPX16_15348 [Anabarilius grahami]|uniref:Uncharacterized protein n=1 Tax=Anabarilius grahami TaxID=495550 RepID=A0A3N0XW60_ANAGA|nr:hypothetical protein DPX16_15348 [Anabarilius grahami]
MIRIFPDFSVQVTAAAAAGAGAGGGMPAASRVPGATNGNPQNVQGLTSYQQSRRIARASPGFLSLYWHAFGSQRRLVSLPSERVLTHGDTGTSAPVPPMALLKCSRFRCQLLVA